MEGKSRIGWKADVVEWKVLWNSVHHKAVCDSTQHVLVQSMHVSTNKTSIIIYYSHQLCALNKTSIYYLHQLCAPLKLCINYQLYNETLKFVQQWCV